MIRLIKWLNTIEGWLLLGNTISFFLPLTGITQANYPQKAWSGLDYFVGIFRNDLFSGMPPTMIQIVFLNICFLSDKYLFIFPMISASFYT